MPRSTAPLTDEAREARNAKARAAYANKKARDAEVKAAADAWRADDAEAPVAPSCEVPEPESDVLVPEPVEVIPPLPPGPVAPAPEHDEEAAEKMREHLVALGNGHAFRSPAVAGRTSVELANLHDVDHALAASSTALCSDRMDRVHAASAEWGAMQAWLKDGASGPRPESSNRIVLHAEKIHGTEQPVRAIVSGRRSRRAATPRPEAEPKAPRQARTTTTVADLVAAGVLLVGDELEIRMRDRRPIGHIVEGGLIAVVGGDTFASPSSAAVQALQTYQTANGWAQWRVVRLGGATLMSVRASYLEAASAVEEGSVASE